MSKLAPLLNANTLLARNVAKLSHQRYGVAIILIVNREDKMLYHVDKTLTSINVS